MSESAEPVEAGGVDLSHVPPVLTAVRARPLSASERRRHATPVVQFNEGCDIMLVDPALSELRDSGSEVHDEQFFKRRFTYDRAYDSTDARSPGHADQATVFADIGHIVLESAFQGFNVSILAYGQTGAGKSFTMMGPPKSRLSEDDESRGLIPRVLEGVFSRIREDPDRGVTVEYDVQVSFLEIYNERVRDLFRTDAAGSGGSATPPPPPGPPPGPGTPPPPVRRTRRSSTTGSAGPQRPRLNLRVREHPEHGPYVEGLSCLPVRSWAEAMHLLRIGNRERAVASTQMNETSSRSHAVFTILLTQRDLVTQARTRAKVHLVDLAGSERVKQSGAKGETLREAVNINQSLSTLGSVITALGDQGQRGGDERAGGDEGDTRRRPSRFAPYRNSVLTWLLRDSMGGTARTIMFANVSPCESAFEETVSTLRFVERAKRIAAAPVRNHKEVNVTTEYVEGLQRELRRAKREVSEAAAVKEEWGRKEEELIGQCKEQERQCDEQRSLYEEQRGRADALEHTVDDLRDVLVSVQGEMQRVGAETEQQLLELQEQEAALRCEHRESMGMAREELAQGQARLREEQERARALQQAKDDERQMHEAAVQELIAEGERTLAAAREDKAAAAKELRQALEQEMRDAVDKAVEDTVAFKDSEFEEAHEAHQRELGQVQQQLERVQQEKETALVEAEEEKETALREAAEEKKAALAEAEHEKEAALAEAEKEKEAALAQAAKEKESALAEAEKEKETAVADAEKQKEAALAEAEEETETALAEAAKEKDAALAEAQREKEAALDEAAKERESALEGAAREKEAALDEAHREAEKRKETALAEADKEREAVLAEAQREKEAALARAAEEKETALAEAQRRRETALAEAHRERETALAVQREVAARDRRTALQEAARAKQEAVGDAVSKASVAMSAQRESYARVLQAVVGRHVHRRQCLAERAAVLLAVRTLRWRVLQRRLAHAQKATSSSSAPAAHEDGAHESASGHHAGDHAAPPTAGRGGKLSVDAATAPQSSEAGPTGGTAAGVGAASQDGPRRASLPGGSPTSQRGGGADATSRGTPGAHPQVPHLPDALPVAWAMAASTRRASAPTMDTTRSEAQGAADARVASLRRQLRVQTARASALKRRADAAEAVAAALRVERRVGGADQEGGGESTDEVAALQSAVTELESALDAERAALEEERSVREHAESLLATRAKETGSLRRQAQVESQRAAAMTSQLYASRSRLQGLRAELMDARDEIERLRCALQAVEEGGSADGALSGPGASPEWGHDGSWSDKDVEVKRHRGEASLSPQSHGYSPPHSPASSPGQGQKRAASPQRSPPPPPPGGRRVFPTSSQSPGEHEKSAASAVDQEALEDEDDAGGGGKASPSPRGDSASTPQAGARESPLPPPEGAPPAASASKSPQGEPWGLDHAAASRVPPAQVTPSPFPSSPPAPAWGADLPAAGPRRRASSTDVDADGRVSPGASRRASWAGAALRAGDVLARFHKLQRDMERRDGDMERMREVLLLQAQQLEEARSWEQPGGSFRPLDLGKVRHAAASPDGAWKSPPHTPRPGVYRPGDKETPRTGRRSQSQRRASVASPLRRSPAKAGVDEHGPLGITVLDVAGSEWRSGESRAGRGGRVNAEGMDRIAKRMRRLSQSGKLRPRARSVAQPRSPASDAGSVPATEGESDSALDAESMISEARRQGENSPREPPSPRPRRFSVDEVSSPKRHLIARQVFREMGTQYSLDGVSVESAVNQAEKRKVARSQLRRFFADYVREHGKRLAKRMRRASTTV